MKHLLSIYMLTFCLFATAGEKVDKTIDVAAESNIEIYNIRGEVNIQGWEKNQAKVVGTLDDLAEEFIFTTSGKTTIIKVKLPRDSSHYSREGSKLKINVPSGAKVTFVGVATDLEIASIDGGIEVNSVSGKVKVNRIKNGVYVNSVSGDLTMNEIVGNLDVSTVSGNLHVKGDCRNVQISGISADLKLNLESINNASISNVSGNSQIFGSLNPEGEIRMSSVSGEAIYWVNDELNAMVSIETAPGGDIINEFSEDQPTSSFINSHTLKFTAGDGNGRIRMSTVSGNIGLKKK